LAKLLKIGGGCGRGGFMISPVVYLKEDFIRTALKNIELQLLVDELVNLKR
jgi:ribulose 1,5-bisphosphate synthetase/thiazole synthase